MDQTAQIVKRIRKLQVPYKEISAASGVSLPTLWNIMRGVHKNLTFSTANKLSKGLTVIERRAKAAKR